ncbi:UBX domain-containing protein 11 [Galemys pyrenaicus]|uniref:UBX domain-containing protein 11 n=1 Tax=Galemys pyrenaicus TaxID=202257 RepID=A0A8J5ZLI3_GALPY|nr:UBX domain-containing protein 11 [Galemys pyrenaicus]
MAALQDGSVALLEDEVDVMSDGHESEEKITVPSCYGRVGAPVSRQAPVSHDSELTTTLMRNMKDLERQVKAQTDEMLTKDRKIQALEELVRTLQEHQGDPQGRLQVKARGDSGSLHAGATEHRHISPEGKATKKRQKELESLCVNLQRQVGEMERFLGDYGLKWVGEPVDQEDSEDRTDSEDDERDWMTTKKFWKPALIRNQQDGVSDLVTTESSECQRVWAVFSRWAVAAMGRGSWVFILLPGDSLVPPEVDFDRLLASLKDLSELVVEGDTQVLPVPGGARLGILEPIPLKLYQNGIIMFDGPFRPFYDPATQRCLRDILDGFFPSELQRLYPDGVPFKVSDLRNQIYPENGLDPFPGEGRTVGHVIRRALDRMERPGSGMTAEKFLNRLPKIVIREGELVDIRGPIRDTLKGRGSGCGTGRAQSSITAFQNCCPLPAQIQEIVVETPALVAERERSQKSPESPSPPLSMLRIKSENGEQVFLLMMQPEDTVGDVRTLLAEARAVDAAAFEIFSTFPPVVYHDDALTLQAAGLVPNAVLLLRPRRN